MLPLSWAIVAIPDGYTTKMSMFEWNIDEVSLFFLKGVKYFLQVHFFKGASWQRQFRTCEGSRGHENKNYQKLRSEWRKLEKGVTATIFFINACPELINPAWPGQRWRPVPRWTDGVTPSCWCFRWRTGEERCLPSPSPGNGWRRFLRRGPRELWPIHGNSAYGSQSI